MAQDADYTLIESAEEDPAGHARIQVRVSGSEDLRYMLAKRGYTSRDVAEEHGCTPSQVSKVLSGQVVSAPIERLVAGKLGISLKQVQLVTRKPRAQAGYPG